MSKKCTDCGGTGKLLDGTTCACMKNKVVSFDFDKSCLSVPMDYRGISFNSNFLPKDLKGSYAEDLDSIYKSIVNRSQMKRNYLVASPAKHGKTLMCCSAIQYLYKSGAEVFPLIDIGELRRVMLDLDNGKTPEILEGIDCNFSSIYTAPYLFVKITDMLQFSVFETMLQILDRKMRRSTNVIFIYNGTWASLVANDKYKKIENLNSDGTFGTLLVKSYWYPKIEGEELSINV